MVAGGVEIRDLKFSYTPDKPLIDDFNLSVKPGMKIADIDPRAEEYDNCFTISDKSRCIAGGVVEAILRRKGERSL